MSEKIKIFVSHHNYGKIIKTDIIEPIQVGRAIADKVFKEMIGDDTGDNISEKNLKYSELTAQYWVWKNYEKIGNPEYIGFMHYRRHFVFNENFDVASNPSWHPEMPVYFVDLNDDCIENLKDEYILKTLEDNADCYAIKPYNIQCILENDMYMKEHYLMTIPGAKRLFWDAFYNAVLKLYPEYKNILDNFTYGRYLNVCNMFIMKKDIFFRYNEFCFNILQETEDNINLEAYNLTNARIMGYLGEYMLTLFIMKLQEENKKLKFLDAIYLKNIDVNPIFNKKNIQMFIDKIFSVKNEFTHKIIRIFGIKFKIRRKYALLQHDIAYNSRVNRVILNRLMIKVSELQNEVFLLKKEREKNEL
ncbi:DUF4422 domain-containing protein [bacterium]|nr:DUF4422 domain-containing protein [bacterium]